jgi:hypothetical protein
VIPARSNTPQKTALAGAAVAGFLLAGSIMFTQVPGLYADSADCQRYARRIDKDPSCRQARQPGIVCFPDNKKVVLCSTSVANHKLRVTLSARAAGLARRWEVCVQLEAADELSMWAARARWDKLRKSTFTDST